MKIFVDSANLNEIKEAVSLGIVDGVTTNPSLVAKEGNNIDFKEHMLKICEILNNPKASVSAEVVSLEYEANPKNPIDDMKACLEVVKEALAKA